MEALAALQTILGHSTVVTQRYDLGWPRAPAPSLRPGRSAWPSTPRRRGPRAPRLLHQIRKLRRDDLVEPLAIPDVAVADAAVGADQEQGGVAADAVRVDGHAVVVGEHGEAVVVLGDERARLLEVRLLALLHLHVDREERDLLAVAAVERLEVRQLAPAGAAPRAPEVEHHDPALERGERNALALEVLERPLGRHLVHAQRIERHALARDGARPGDRGVEPAQRAVALEVEIAQRAGEAGVAGAEHGRGADPVADRLGLALRLQAGRAELGEHQLAVGPVGER